MAKQKTSDDEIDGETSLQYILDEDDSHLPFTEQRFLRILVNPIDVVSVRYTISCRCSAFLCLCVLISPKLCGFHLLEV